MIDSHCHINDPMFENDPESYILEAKNSGVSKFLIVGYDLKSSRIAVDFANKYEDCYAAVGIHPSDYAKAGPNDLDEIDKLANNSKVIAVGEIGLDYYWEKDENVRLQQKEGFIKQIEIANKHNLPISIHCREAMEDCYKILKEHKAINAGVMHCFAGSKEMANEFIKLGYVLGFGGVITFKNAAKSVEVMKNIPSNSYLLETDSPYLTPVPFRGKPNHSKYLYLVREKIAEIRGETIEKVDEDSTNNFNRVFLK